MLSSIFTIGAESGISFNEAAVFLISYAKFLNAIMEI